MLKMFLCESHMIFLSKLREHSVANVVHKVTSNWEVIFFSLCWLCFQCHYVPGPNIVLQWLSCQFFRYPVSETLPILGQKQMVLGGGFRKNKASLIFFLIIQHFLFESKYSKNLTIRHVPALLTNKCSIARGVAQVREDNGWVNVNVYFDIL